MINLYEGLIATCPECGDEAGVCEHRYGNNPTQTDTFVEDTIPNDICEHGMSAWLCMGPNHYPTMQDEMEGRYY